MRAAVACAVLLALALAHDAAAACPDVDVRQDDEHRYGERRDGEHVWCEGRYAESTSGGMTAVGFGRGAAVERHAGDLVVHWPPVDRPATLRIRSRRSRDYYLLDAEAPPRESRFAWPPAVLDAIDIEDRDLVAELRAEWDGHQALVPVGADGGQLLKVAFLSAVGFEEITAELWRVEADGEEPVPWEDQREIGPVLQDQLFRVTLPAGLAAGLYRLKVIGRTRTRPVPAVEYLWVP